MGSKNAAFHEGVLASLLLSPLKLVFSLTLGLVVLLLCVWVIDWLFVFKFWPQGIERLRELLAHDLAGGITLCAQQGGSASAITAPANALYAIVFEATGIHEMGTQFADGGSLSIPDTIVRRAACDPPGLRRTRVSQPLPPGQVPAVGGAGARWARSVDVAGSGALAAVRAVGCAGNGRLGECAVGLLQEALVGTATLERSEAPVSCSGACRGLRPHTVNRGGGQLRCFPLGAFEGNLGNGNLHDNISSVTVLFKCYMKPPQNMPWTLPSTPTCVKPWE